MDGRKRPPDNVVIGRLQPGVECGRLHLRVPGVDSWIAVGSGRAVRALQRLGAPSRIR